MSIKPSITRGLGALTPSAWKDIVGAIDAINELSITRPPKTAGGDRERFLATIGVATQISGRAIWNYEWTQVRAQTTASSVTTSNVSNGLNNTTQG